MKLTIRILFFCLLIFQTSFSEGQKRLKFKGKEKTEKAQHAEYEFAEGMKYFILGNLSEAFSHFESSQKLAGDNAAVYYMLAKIYRLRYKPDLALQYAQKAAKISSKNKYYYMLIAELYEQQQNLNEAVKTYKKMLAEIPKSEDVYYHLADIYFYQKNYDEALKAFEKIEGTFGKSLPVTQRKQTIYLQQNNLQKAIEEGDALIQAYPDEVDYKTAQAEFLYKNKMADKAIVILEDVIKGDPENSYARLLLSDIYQSQGNKEKSDLELESVFNNPETDLNTKLNIISGYLKAKDTEYNRNKALQLSEATVKAHPSEAKAYAVLGESLRRTGKRQEAWENFIKSKNIDNSSFPVWVELLGLDADLNKTDSLLKHSEQALETFPNQAVLWLYNGIGYSSKKNYSKAVESLEEGKKLSAKNPELQYQFQLQLADNYYYAKEYAKSDATFEEVLKADPENDHALNNYSYFLSLRKDKLDLAKTMGQKLIEKHPDEANYLDTYAWVLYQMKNYQEAKSFLEKAIQGSENGTIVEHYGDVLFQLGQKDQAVEQWIKAKKLGETSENIDKKIADKKLYE